MTDELERATGEANGREQSWEQGGRARHMRGCRIYLTHHPPGILIL